MIERTIEVYRKQTDRPGDFDRRYERALHEAAAGLEDIVVERLTLNDGMQPQRWRVTGAESDPAPTPARGRKKG